MACQAASTIEWPTILARADGQLADAPATRSDFCACVDRCVRALASATPPALANGSLNQLRHWLHGARLTLADGTPVDLSLFDETILSASERIAPANDESPAQLLSASRRLAESVYAKALERRKA